MPAPCFTPPRPGPSESPGTPKAWSGRYQPAEENRAFHDLFRELFLQASCMLFKSGAAIRDMGGRRPEDYWDAGARKAHTVAIFLDDLDRCRQERVLEVLEAINLFLDLPGVCFYLGIDMERLEALLPEPLADHKAEFLEKIVRISLDLSEMSQLRKRRRRHHPCRCLPERCSDL